MAKSYFNAKLVTQQILEGRAAQKSDQDIYRELSEVYYDKKALATLITSVPLEEDKRKYKAAWIALLTLLMIGAVSKVLLVVFLSIAMHNAYALLLTLLVPIINVAFFFGIKNYTASMYRLCGMLTLASMLQMFNLKDAEPVDVGISFGFGLLIVVLAFYLDAKLFPKYKPYSMEKDANGDYRVE